MKLTDELFAKYRLIEDTLLRFPAKLALGWTG